MSTVLLQQILDELKSQKTDRAAHRPKKTKTESEAEKTLRQTDSGNEKYNEALREQIRAQKELNDAIYRQ